LAVPLPAADPPERFLFLFRLRFRFRFPPPPLGFEPAPPEPAAPPPFDALRGTSLSSAMKAPAYGTVTSVAVPPWKIVHWTGHTGDMDSLQHSGSIVINRSPEEVYALISDVRNTGEWSPMCKACWWDEGDGPRVGAMFTGRNEMGERTWETRSEVLAADPGKEFAWAVAEPPTRARWGYRLTAVEGGTEVTETWELPPEGLAFFEERFPGDGAAQAAIRADWAEKGIPETLAAIKKAAEA
jgi:Polyketide cyclase / dehydrase and lipid transport